MKRSTFALSIIFSLVLLEIGLCLASQLIFAQSHNEPSSDPTTQEQPLQNDENTASVNTFSGKIVKSGDKFALAASDNLTTYQLDDQQKAHDFLDKTVRVTGSLDASTGTIRVTAIDASPRR